MCVCVCVLGTSISLCFVYVLTYFNLVEHVCIGSGSRLPQLLIFVMTISCDISANTIIKIRQFIDRI